MCNYFSYIIKRIVKTMLRKRKKIGYEDPKLKSF